MIYFTSEEILFSVIASLVFGASFGGVFSLLSLIKPLIKAITVGTASGVRLPLKKIRRIAISDYEEGSTAVGTMLTVILFALLYVLISYIALDGAVRIYTLLISLSSAAIIKYISAKSLTNALKILFELLIYVYSISLSLLAAPLRGTILLVLRIFGKKAEKLTII